VTHKTSIRKERSDTHGRLQGVPISTLLQDLGPLFAFIQRLGRAVAQAVSLWFPTAAARVRVRVACGVCGGQSGTGAGFLRVLRFPLPIIPPISTQSTSPIIWGWYNRPVVAEVPKVPQHKLKKKIRYIPHWTTGAFSSTVTDLVLIY
jgi:hypothetical protein